MSLNAWTWADGFGVWHVELALTDNYESAEETDKLAEALALVLLSHEVNGRHQDEHVSSVERVSRVNNSGSMSYRFKENS